LGWLRIVLSLVFVLAAVGTYGWYSLQNSCKVKAVQEAAARLVRQKDRYDHSYQFATSVSPGAVVRPVAELQQILMDTQQVEVPACMQTAKEELVNYMGIVIRAFLAYGAGETDQAVRELINASEGHYDNFANELKAVDRCAPLCIR